MEKIPERAEATVVLVGTHQTRANRLHINSERKKFSEKHQFLFSSEHESGREKNQVRSENAFKLLGLLCTPP